MEPDSIGFLAFDPDSDIGKLVETTVDAFSSMPLLARLEFVRALLAINGGSKISYPADARLVIATEVLTAAIEIVETRPRTAKLDRPIYNNRPRSKAKPTLK